MGRMFSLTQTGDSEGKQLMLLMIHPNIRDNTQIALESFRTFQKFLGLLPFHHLPSPPPPPPPSPVASPPTSSLLSGVLPFHHLPPPPSSPSSLSHPP